MVLTLELGVNGQQLRGILIRERRGAILMRTRNLSTAAPKARRRWTRSVSHSVAVQPLRVGPHLAVGRYGAKLMAA